MDTDKTQNVVTINMITLKKMVTLSTFSLAKIIDTLKKSKLQKDKKYDAWRLGIITEKNLGTKDSNKEITLYAKEGSHEIYTLINNSLIKTALMDSHQKDIDTETHLVILASLISQVSGRINEIAKSEKDYDFNEALYICKNKISKT